MRLSSRDDLSMLVIRLALGAGGSFLCAAFALEAFQFRGFMIPAAASVFVLVLVSVYVFTRIKPQFFLVATVVWFLILWVIAPS